MFETGFDKRLIGRRDVARGDNLDRVGVTDESLELGGDRSRLVCDQSFDVELILDVRLLVVAGHACNEDGAQQRHQCENFLHVKKRFVVVISRGEERFRTSSGGTRAKSTHPCAACYFSNTLFRGKSKKLRTFNKE